MAKKNSEGSNGNGGTSIQFSLTGLIVFSISLVAATALLTHFLEPRLAGSRGADVNVDGLATAGSANQPWGELLMHNIELERPAEYVAYEAGSNQPPVWVFPGMSVDQVREVMTASGLTAAESQGAIAPDRLTVTPSNVIARPDEDMLLKLPAAVRGKLYTTLCQFPENHYIKYPFIFPGHSFEGIAKEHKINGQSLELLKQLLYSRGDNDCFSDFQLVMRRLPAEDDRIKLIQALSRQSAVLARLHIRPNTDIDKLLGYWGSAPGVHLKDVRPLLESIKRLPNGGSMSLLYMLPQFARQRLYTFPMPAQAGDPRMDCHWSTMNFFNEAPDNRFNDSGFTSKYLTDHYYPIAKATAYGDLIFLLDDKNNAVHSAVYIADDIVFTKNGDNYLQPWMLMHFKDLLGTYSVGPAPRIVVYRNKNT